MGRAATNPPRPPDWGNAPILNPGSQTDWILMYSLGREYNDLTLARSLSDVLGCE